MHVPTPLCAGFPSGWRVALGWLARGSCCVSRCWSARCGGRFSLGLLLALVGTAPLCACVCVRPCGFRWLACGNRTLLRVERKKGETCSPGVAQQRVGVRLPPPSRGRACAHARGGRAAGMAACAAPLFHENAMLCMKFVEKSISLGDPHQIDPK